MKFYAYCLVDRALEGVEIPSGITGQQVEVLDVDGLFAVVSKLENEVVGVTRENVLRHEAVVRSVLAETSPLPFRFGTLVTKESLGSYVKSRGKALLERLDLVRDSIEMSVKIIWQVPADEPATTEMPANVGIGAAFLLSKRQEVLGNQKVNALACEIGSWLDRGIGRFVRRQSVNIQPTQKLVLAASYLIDRPLESDFRTAIGQLEAERPELHFLTSGPWPPYTFANIDLEFETQFGVS
jgi:hypothetical protein